jgi:hypothetical protein
MILRVEAGTFYYANGSTYQGEWVENRRHGYGVLQGHSGSAFHGEWRQVRP